jgi:hypothetical protein
MADPRALTYPDNGACSGAGGLCLPSAESDRG